MRPQRVLICAETSTAERVADVLRSRGYAAETATDRHHAVELAERNEPEVVLAWSDLPGAEAAAMVREVRDGSQRRVAAVLRASDTNQAQAVLEAGADALLLDNPDLEFLAWAVERVFEGGLVVDPALARSLVAAPDAAPAPSEVPPERPSDGGEPSPDEPAIQFQECDVAHIVQEGAAEAAGGYPAAVVVKDTGMPALTAVAEPAALREVIRILVHRAYSDSENDSDVKIKALQGDAGITVHITDKGPGLDREQRAELASGAVVAPGQPVPPLALAKKLVALHGGILWAEPLPAGGTRFAFTIPQKPPVLEGEALEDALRTLELVRQPAAAPEVKEISEEAEVSEAEVPDEGPLAEAGVPDEEPLAEVEAQDEEPVSEPVSESVSAPVSEPVRDLAAEEAAAAQAEATFAELWAGNLGDIVLSVDDLLEIDPGAARLEEGTGEPEPEPETEPVHDAAAEAEAAAMADAAVDAPEEPSGTVLSLAELVQVDPDARRAAEQAEAVEPEAVQPERPEPEPDVEVQLYDQEEAEAEEPVEAAEPEPEPLEAEPLPVEVLEREPVEVFEPEPESVEVVEPEPEPVEVEVVEPEPEPEPVEVFEPEPVEVPEPEPEPIAVAASAGAEQAPQATKKPLELEVTVKRFIPDPLDPATAMLRSLSEDYDPQADGFLNRQ